MRRWIVASTQDFVDHVVGLLDEKLGVTSKKMFGEYGLFCEGKMFGLVCDDRFLVKPTAGGRAFIGKVVEASPYPGARPCFLIEEQLDDGEWLSELARITTRELPEPRRRKRKPRQST
jgi:TfoX/Sxy family transcriptional regulator of competence genes